MSMYYGAVEFTTLLIENAYVCRSRDAASGTHPNNRPKIFIIILCEPPLQVLRDRWQDVWRVNHTVLSRVSHAFASENYNIFELPKPLFQLLTSIRNFTIRLYNEMLTNHANNIARNGGGERQPQPMMTMSQKPYLIILINRTVDVSLVFILLSRWSQRTDLK